MLKCFGEGVLFFREGKEKKGGSIKNNDLGIKNTEKKRKEEQEEQEEQEVQK